MKEINWEIYSSQEELDKIMFDYIRETAKELKLELSRNIKDTKKIEYV